MDTPGQAADIALPANAAGADAALIASLQRGDERAFVLLIEQYHAQLVRMALLYVNDRTVAEEVAQETWIGVLNGLARFEQRSSLKTWIFQILINQARTRGKREAHSIPFSALAPREPGPAEPAVDAERFRGPADRWPGHWATPPQSWAGIPEEHLLSQETRATIQQAIAVLPASQREIITLRDLHGWTAAEVCQALQISEANQRVLLHRARSKVRRALETYLNGI
jgi:RNA polymerase sigma-70 factor (ECF subfamily)